MVTNSRTGSKHTRLMNFLPRDWNCSRSNPPATNSSESANDWHRPMCDCSISRCEGRIARRLSHARMAHSKRVLATRRIDLISQSLVRITVAPRKSRRIFVPQCDCPRSRRALRLPNSRWRFPRLNDCRRSRCNERVTSTVGSIRWLASRKISRVRIFNASSRSLLTRGFCSAGRTCTSAS